MTRTSLKINHESIRRKIEGAAANSSVIRRLAYQKAYGIFRNAKRMMLKEFDRHNVTQEILAGPTALNISGTLGGYGNLFSFIGFDSGSEPIEALQRTLEMGTYMRQTVYRNKAWYFQVTLPTNEAVSKASQMPWEHGNSWAFAVEKEISGLSHYMYRRKGIGSTSKSGTGLQIGVDGETEHYDYQTDPVFTSVLYITEILRNFRERINRER